MTCLLFATKSYPSASHIAEIIMHRVESNKLYNLKAAWKQGRDLYESANQAVSESLFHRTVI